MSHHTIDELRSTLFDTLQALKNKKDPMDIERARAVTDVAQVIVNTVKVEIDHMRLTNRTGSSFIPAAEAANPRLPGDIETVATAHGSKTITQLPGGATITRHKMAG